MHVWHALERTCYGAALLGAALFAPWSAPSNPTENLHRNDPPLAHTGGWGEPTCRACHSDSELNSPDVRLDVDGFPEQYIPGQTYTIVISIAGAGQISAGFQASTRYADGPSTGLQAGRLEGLNDRVRIRTDTIALVQYAHHTEAGAQLVGEERGAWTILWRAPEVEQDVLLNVAANSANGDDSPIGDLINTLEKRSAASPVEHRR